MSVVAQQLNPLPGYEQLWGSKKAFLGELVGPTLYASGGQTVNASQLGWGGFDMVQAPCLSLSGTYMARVQLLPLDAAPSEFLGACASVKVVWYVVATGAEAGAVDLSTEVMRLFAIGV